MAACRELRVFIRSSMNVCRISSRTFNFLAPVVSIVNKSNSLQRLNFAQSSAIQVNITTLGHFANHVRLYSDEKPSSADIKRRVMDVCKSFEKISQSGVDKLSDDSSFMNDLGMDSLDHVELVMAMEDEFGFEIPDAEAEKLLRPADIMKYISDHYEAVHI